MKKWIFGLGILFTVAVSTGHDHQEEGFVSFTTPVKSFTSEDPEYVSPDSVPTGRLTVVGESLSGFTGEKGEKMLSAFRVLEEVVNSEEFKERVINFENSNGDRAFASNNELSNEEIYALFMEGRETLQQNTPHEMNFWLRLYNRPWSRVIGYTNGNTNVISINWKYFKRNGLDDVAANLAHEWVHKLGFGHKSAKEHDSVPYGIGYIVGDLVRARLANQLH